MNSIKKLAVSLTMVATIILCSAEGRTEEKASVAPYVEFFKALEGVWDYKLYMPGDVGEAETGTVNWARRANGHTVRGYWRSVDGKSSTELLGFRTSDQSLKSTGYGEDGNHWNLDLPEVTATSLKGHCKGMHPNGVAFEGAFKATIDGDQYSWSVTGKTASGEPHHFRGECKRRSRASDSLTVAIRCPWIWMLGQWKVERSDGTSAVVTWKQPRRDVDVLHGEWKESDGTVRTETVGWQTDRNRLISNSYGPSGVFFAVSFNDVKDKAMSGFFRSRALSGKVTFGRVELNRISDSEVRSKLTDNNGDVVTGVFTRMP